MYGLGATLLLLIFYLFNNTAEISFFSRKMIWFLLFSLAGILFSMPFLPTFGRNLAVSAGFNALLILLGLYGALNFILQKIQKDKSLMNVNALERRQGFSTTFMFALLFGIVVSPFLLLILPKSASQKVNLTSYTCPNGRDLVAVDLRSDAYLNIGGAGNGIHQLPLTKYKRIFDRNIHRAPDIMKNSARSLIQGVNVKNRNAFYFLLADDIIQPQWDYAVCCISLKRENGYQSAQIKGGGKL